MRKYMKYHGVNIDNANGLPVFEISPEAAMAGMPDGFWNVLYDPDEVILSESSALNRVTGVVVGNIPPGGIPLANFPNGATAFFPDATNNIGFESDKAISPEAWTVFTVADVSADTTIEDIVNNRSGEDTAPLYAPRIAITLSGNALVVYAHGGRNSSGPQRLSYNGSFNDRSEPTLLMVTFSTERGLAIWDNGEQVAHDPDDVQPLETDTGAGEWRTFRFARSSYGLTGQLNADLGLPRNAIYRRMIERHVADKYGITAMQGL